MLYWYQKQSLSPQEISSVWTKDVNEICRQVVLDESKLNITAQVISDKNIHDTYPLFVHDLEFTDQEVIVCRYILPD